MKIKSIIVLTMLSFAGLAREDTPLVTAVLSDDLTAFQAFLEKGEDPNSLERTSSSRWLMCTAARNFDTQFLELSVRYGGNINLRNPTAGYAHVSPIACAISVGNIDGIDWLLEKDIDTEALVCSKCEETSYKSYLPQFAIYSGRMDSAIKLYTDVKFSDVALQAMIKALESNPYIAKPQVKYRDELIRILEADGHTINLRERKKR